MLWKALRKMTLPSGKRFVKLTFQHVPSGSTNYNLGINYLQ